MQQSNIRSLFSNVRYPTYRSDVFPTFTNFQWFDEKVYLDFQPIGENGKLSNLSHQEDRAIVRIIANSFHGVAT